MQPLQQTGPLVALRFVLLGDPHEASLLAQGLDMGTQKYSGHVRALSRYARSFGVSIVILESLAFDYVRTRSAAQLASFYERTDGYEQIQTR